MLTKAHTRARSLKDGVRLPRDIPTEGHTEHDTEAGPEIYNHRRSTEFLNPLVISDWTCSSSPAAIARFLTELRAGASSIGSILEPSRRARRAICTPP